jgi:hypothetical protein
VELAGLKSERSQTMTDTIDDAAADATGQEPTVPPPALQTAVLAFEVLGDRQTGLAGADHARIEQSIR